MWGGPTMLYAHVEGGFIYLWSVRARTMSLTSAFQPVSTRVSTIQTQPRHLAIAVPSVHAPSPQLYCSEAFLPRPLCPFRSPYPRASSLLRPPSSPSPTPPCHHNCSLTRCRPDAAPARLPHPPHPPTPRPLRSRTSPPAHSPCSTACAPTPSLPHPSPVLLDPPPPPVHSPCGPCSVLYVLELGQAGSLPSSLAACE